jgi:hypothetical protein
MLYLLFRSCSRRPFGPLHFFEYLKLTTPGPIFALCVVAVPIIIFLLIVEELIVQRMMTDVVSCNFSSFYCDQGAARAMRISQVRLENSVDFAFSCGHFALICMFLFLQICFLRFSCQSARF